MSRMNEVDTEQQVAEENNSGKGLAQPLKSSPGRIFHYEQLTGSPCNVREDDIVFTLIKQKKVKELELFLNECCGL